MMLTVALEFSERIRRLPVYPAAGGYGDRAPPVRLASNESPYPPLPAVREAIQRALATLNRYPDPASSLLRARLSDRYEVPSARIAIGNGSCDILLAAGEALLEPGAELVYAWPSFSVYPHLAAASGARAVTVPLDSRQRHDLAAILREITVATRLVIVCNPNNPTGTALPLSDVAAFLAEVPAQVCVIVDEAYCEFNLLDDPDASLALLGEHPNLVLLRTFSKVHGLCGLRVGFALCGSDDLPRAVDQVRQPFFCNALAQAAAVEALAHQDAVVERVTKTVAERTSVMAALAEMGIQAADSQANFCWLELGEERDEAEIMHGLQERGVLVRGGGALGSRTPALRVTVGTPEENARFLQALAEVLALAPGAVSG
jgi:histidinol-phosphate aminotransferase